MSIERASKIVDVTTGYTPRKMQDYIHRHLKRFNVLVIHRRAGKTVLSINEMVDQGMKCPNKNPQITYIAPTYGMAKRIAWDYLKDAVKGYPFLSIHEHELRIDLQRPDRGDRVRLMLLGADNINALRGIYIDLAVLDEFGEMNPEIWTHVVRPALSDREGGAIFIGCVAKDTLIIGENGIEEIGSSPVGYSDEDKWVWGLGGFHKAENRYGNPKMPTKILKTKAGIILEATPNHRIWTPGGWQRMDELKSGDPLYMQIGQNVYGKESCDLDFAWFLGLYLAEGSSEDKIYRVTITSIDEEIHARLSRLYGFKRADKYHTRLNSKAFYSRLCQWFYDAGFVRAPQKYLPKKITQLNERCLKALLRGYFDGDGTCHKYKQSVSCVTSSARLYRQLHCIFLNMGYRATASTRLVPPNNKCKRETISHRIEIDGDSAVKFAREIGFFLERKQLRTLTWKNHNGHEYWFNRRDFVRLNGHLGYLGRVKKVRRKILDTIDYSHKYDRSLLADEVSSITDSKNESFDFCIPDTKSYFSNGLVSHNTVKGKNHFYDMYEFAKRDTTGRWFHAMFKADETKILPQIELDEAKATMGEEAYNQEYLCDWASALVGAYFAKEMSNAEKEGRICDVPYDPSFPVNTFWDLGISDAMAIWFIQRIGGRNLCIDYHEDSGPSLEHYVKVLEEKKYVYGTHELPHDGNIRDIGSGETRRQVLYRLGLKNVLVQKKHLKRDSIDAARRLIPICLFDRVKTSRGVDALKSYRRKWDAERKVFNSEPIHDHSSHGSDAFQCAAMSASKYLTGTEARPTMCITDYDEFER